MNTIRIRRQLVKLLIEQDWKCYYCSAPVTLSVLYEIAPEIWKEQGIKRATLEHLHPDSCKGPDNKHNTVAACGPCNNHRHDNPQCHDNKTLIYRGEVIAVKSEDGKHWNYRDGTTKPIKTAHTSDRRKKIKNQKSHERREK